MSTQDPIHQYQYLWDGSQPGWVLIRICGHVVELTLRFKVSGPSARELMAVRRTVPVFKSQPLDQVSAQLRGREDLPLGRFESSEARTLAASCRAAGLNVLEEVIDVSGYVPTNEMTSRALLIEDNEMAKQVCDAAFLHGVPVRHSEV